MVSKVSVIVSIILFCVGIGVYSFIQLSLAGKGKNVDLLSFVPAESKSILETDNVELLVSEFPLATYALQLDTFRQSGLFPLIFQDLFPDEDNGVHRLSNGIDRMMVSFHPPISSRNVVMYFQTHESGKDFLQRILQKEEGKFIPKKESYRGEDIFIHTLKDGDFIAAYYGKGFCIISFQKRLIERVIDSKKDKTSLRTDSAFMEGYESKSANFMALYAHAPTLPCIEEIDAWSSHDIHLNSDVFYLNGSMLVPDSCTKTVFSKLEELPTWAEDSLIAVAGQAKVDSCITQMALLPQRTLFDECIANLSHEASFIFVADLDKVATNPQRYQMFLPEFVCKHVGIFRSFILSIQLTKIGNRISHIFVFTYKK